MQKRRVGILISGRGSNMQALVKAMRQPGFPAEPVVVLSNRPNAEGLAWAKAQGIPAPAIDHNAYANRMAFEARLHQALLDHKVDLICNAGFMRMLTGGFVDRWRDRLVVGYGKRALAIVDPSTRRKAGDIPLKGHPESFQFDEQGQRLFVNVPDVRQIAVVNLHRLRPEPESGLLNDLNLWGLWRHVTNPKITENCSQIIARLRFQS